MIFAEQYPDLHQWSEPTGCSQKMPTIQLYKGGEKVAEHIAAEGAIDALEKVRSGCGLCAQLT